MLYRSAFTLPFLGEWFKRDPTYLQMQLPYMCKATIRWQALVENYFIIPADKYTFNILKMMLIYERTLHQTGRRGKMSQ